MYPGYYAADAPNHPAAINAATNEVLTYGQLDARSNQLAHFFHEKGLRRNDHVAIFMENNLRFFEVAWAALRSGLYITTINRYLTAEEAAYIVNDSGAKALVSSYAMSAAASELGSLIPGCPNLLMTDGLIEGWGSYEEQLDQFPESSLAEQWQGGSMLYSSGTTGRPKGILRPLPEIKVTDIEPTAPGIGSVYGFDRDTVYLSPAPLYHAAPFGFTTGVQRLGGTVVVMPRFDPLDALRCIEEFEISHSQWVPTMFVRMLKLSDEERSRYRLNAHRVAVHAAAPCPVDVKRRMIEWWGPILEEYYAGTEGNGSTAISSEEWLEHPGSVGRSRSGVLHVCNDDGDELPPGEAGVIYFEQPEMTFSYHNAPEKTREAQHPKHLNWSALGDVGYLDEEGYLFLTDRKSFMIISGGVNIYPQEIENALIMHPNVMDVAVFGVPNDDFGEEVKAVIQLAEDVKSDESTAEDLIDYSRKHLANYMVPRSIDFIEEMPRLPTGKLYKRLLRDAYWGKRDSRIV